MTAPVRGSTAASCTEVRIMADLERIIMDDIESYGVKATDIGIEVKTKGVFKKKRYLNVFGAVGSEDDKATVDRVVKKYSGDTYEVIDELKVVKKLL